MDRVHSVEQRPVSEIKHAAVAIRTVDQDQRHVAILHQDQGEVYRLDLAWHFHLRNDVFGSSRYLWIDAPIPNVRKRQLAAKCRQIWRANRHNRIPFGFGQPTDCFDETTHEYLIGPSKHGLTCASFVLAVFHSAGIVLIKYDSWPVDRGGDREWQDAIIAELEQQGAQPEHIQALRNDVGCARFRPEEVAGAATQQPPCEFAAAERVSRDLLTALPQ